MRTHYCGEVTLREAGQTISLCGWVHTWRNHGGVLFIDLRDRTGITQVVAAPENAEAFKAADNPKKSKGTFKRVLRNMEQNDQEIRAFLNELGAN